VVVWVLFISGDHVPVIPLSEVVGNGFIEEPEHTGAKVTNVGIVFGNTVIVISFLQVTPLVVTSHQYVVVSVGVGLIVAVVSPVDQR
jgi:hypothetical protein